VTGGGDTALVISGGGSVRVSTGELLAESSALRTLVAAADGWVADVPADLHSVPRYGGRLADSAAAASGELSHAARLAQQFAGALDQSADSYDVADGAALAMLRALSGGAGYLLGLSAPILLALAAGSLPVMAAEVQLAALAARVGGGDPEATAEVARLLRDPTFVMALRAAVSSVDDAMMGAARLPPLLAALLGESGLSWFDVAGAATVVIGLAPGGALAETPISVRAAKSGTAPPPAGFADIARRIPPNPEGAPQIRIERYEGDDGESKWMVYFAGTIDPGVVPAGEPWDDTSNVRAMAGGNAGSVRAALEAMQLAGIQAGDEVVLAGYSQGGIVASAVAQTGRYDVSTVVSYGAPVGGHPVPEGTSAVSIEHVDDIIPALGGLPLDTAHGGSDRVVVRGPSGADDDDPSMLAAHDIANYTDTASRLDDVDDDRLDAARRAIERVTAGGAAEVTTYRADRVPDGTPRAGGGAEVSGE
jgi:hypothetical protein